MRIRGLLLPREQKAMDKAMAAIASALVLLLPINAQAALTQEFYTYGGHDAVVSAFSKVALIFGGSGYQSLFATLATASLAALVIRVMMQLMLGGFKGDGNVAFGALIPWLLSVALFSGINVFLLLSARYQSPYWLTFKQAAERGGQIRKGEKGYPIVFWSKTEKEDQQTGEVKEVGFLRYYTVFNVAQIDGLKDVPAIEANQISENGAEAIDAAELIVASMPDRPQITHGHTRACYSPAWDRVEMPVSISFDGPAEYYSTLFHELTHATGHEKRLNRHQTIKNHAFGSADYSKEELVAEFGSAFLCAESGISQAVISNQTAYIQGWLKALKNDNKLLINAAAQAQKAADWIMGRIAQ